MPARTFYIVLGAFALVIASGAAGLAVFGAAVAQPLSSGATALCAAIFVVPGLVFLAYARKLTLREVALKHVAAIIESRGVLEMDALAEELSISREDAERILRTAIHEGHVRGTPDDRGRFVAVTAPHCPSCGASLSGNPPEAICLACRSTISR